MIVVADTTPLNYLVLIGQADVLGKLFGGVIVPPAVFEELQHARTPEAIRRWVAQRPPWLTVVGLATYPDAGLSHLDKGEREAIALAEELHADQLLVDETEARQEAVRRKLVVIGTLGVLRKAARMKLIRLSDVLGDLQKTTFYVNPDLIRRLLEEEAEWKKPKLEDYG